MLLKETKKMEDLTAVSSKIMVTPKKLRKIKHTPTTSTSVSASGTTTAADAAIDSTSRDGGSVAVVEESDTEAGIHSASDSIHDILNDRVVTDQNDQNDELINKTAGKFYDSINERILPSKSPSKIVNDHQHRIISSIADKWVLLILRYSHRYIWVFGFFGCVLLYTSLLTFPFSDFRKKLHTLYYPLYSQS